MQRIVAGTLRGRRLLGLPRTVTGVRPSSERVRSAIFDRLQHEVVGATVLDLFAGSGALAIEAISRGAAHAVLVETQRELARFLAAQLDALSLRSRCDLVHADALRWLQQPATRRFELVLVDPPYDRLDLYDRALELLAGPEQSWLASDATIVVEYEKQRGARPSIRVPERFVCEALREHGQTALEFLRLRGDP